MSSSDFFVCYQNVRGLKSKVNEFFNNVSISNFDCICLTETWLNNSFFSSELFDDRYVVYRKDRDFSKTKKQDGGGVILCVKKSLATERVYCLEAEGNESLWVKVHLGRNSSFLICVVYFSPGSTKESYKSFFKQLDNESFSSGILMIGDFNLPVLSKYLLRGNSGTLPPLETYVLQMINYYNLNQMNNVLNTNDYCLDFVLSDLTPCQVAKADFPLVPPDPHHPCLEISCRVIYVSDPHVNTPSSYNFKRADSYALYFLLRDVDWQALYRIHNVDLAVDHFYRILYSVLDESVPKTIPLRKKYPPWFNRQIIIDLKHKEKLRRKFKKSRLGTDYLNFSAARSRLKIQINLAKREFEIEREEGINQNPNNFWNYVRNKKSSNNNPKVFVHEGRTLTSKNDICEAFANHFQSVYSPITPKINLKAIFDLPMPDDIEILNITSFSREELQLAFKKLKSKRSKGDDQLPQYFFKCYAELLLDPLLYIYNLCLTTSQFPTKWKRAAICPIPKTSMTKLVSEHRPISLLSTPGKLLESLLHFRIFHHIAPKVSPHQYGFLPRRSTSTNLINFVEEVTKAFNNGNQLDVLYTDFRKAFDLVSFEVLLKKLHLFGFSSPLIKFFHSYLVNRSQYVLYESCKSKPFIINSSVPQGSNLGPLLFSLLVNDLPSTVKFSTPFLFADDLKITKEIEKNSDCIEFQDDISAIEKWSHESQLQFNLDKCFVVTFSLKRDNINAQYNLGGQSLSRKIEAKDLGVWFDRKLNFEKHVSIKVNESYRLLGFIKRCSQSFVNPKTEITLFNTFIRSKLEYCSLVWDPIHANKIHQIEKLQKKFLKYLGKKYRQLDLRLVRYDDLLQTYDIDSLEKRRKITNLLYIYKVLNNRENNPLVLSKFNFNVGTANTRSRTLFYQPAVRLNVAKNSPINRMCELINQYPELDPFSLSLQMFREKCQQLL